MLKRVAVSALVILDRASQVDQFRRLLSTHSTHWKAARDQAAWNWHLARWPFTG